jgi:hypothetical protein
MTLPLTLGLAFASLPTASGQICSGTGMTDPFIPAKD